jgi:hypothetical protein
MHPKNFVVSQGQRRATYAAPLASDYLFYEKKDEV